MGNIISDNNSITVLIILHCKATLKAYSLEGCNRIHNMSNTMYHSVVWFWVCSLHCNRRKSIGNSGGIRLVIILLLHLFFDLGWKLNEFTWSLLRTTNIQNHHLLVFLYVSSYFWIHNLRFYWQLLLQSRYPFLQK